MEKSIIIIGAGVGGLATGIYGQLNGYKTQIFEMHYLPGGQCTAWKRNGYTFDVCVHHLFGCNETSKVYRLWEELGAMPRKLIRTNECVSVVSPEGKMFNDYYDTDKLEKHLKELSPADSKLIEEYIKAIKKFTKMDLLGESMYGSLFRLALPVMMNLKYFKHNMQSFADKFQNQFLKSAFPMLEYSNPRVPLMLHLLKHAYGKQGSILWPKGGAQEFARSIEKKYNELGGKVNYAKRVEKILVENNKAVGVRLADGTEHKADIIISNADGRKTILNMLEGKYLNEKIKEYCKDPADEMPWGVHVFLGVKRDLSKEPSALVMQLKEPVVIAGHENKNLEMQMYGFDKTMAPKGKGVIKVELVSKYSYWKKLYKDKKKYNQEKTRIAKQVIDILDKHHFKGIKKQVEVIDVPTIMTWERYMGGTYGFANFPNKKFDFNASLLNKFMLTLPGLDNFYFVGAWSTSIGALFTNAYSGRKVIQKICNKDHKKFVSKKA